MGQGTIPSDWAGEYCCYAVQWPNSPQWLAVLRGVLALPATGRFWDEHTGVITEAQAVIVETYDNNLHFEEVLMACNDNVSNALGSIAIALTAVANSRSTEGCCNTPQGTVGGSIQGTVVPPVSGGNIPVYGSTPPDSLPPATFPDGYDDLDEYLLDKCRKANSLVNATIAANKALGAITSFNFTGLTVLVVMALGGILVVAPELIPILVAGIILLGASVSYLDAAGDYMQDNKEDWVCSLYNSDSTEDMIGLSGGLLDILIAAIGATGVIGFTVKTIILVLLNVDNLNKLLTNAPMLGVTEIDCTVCDCDILTYDFTDSDNGYAFAADSCFGTTPSSAGASIAWSSSGLELIAPNVGSANFVNAWGPGDLNIEIQAGWELVITGHRVADFNNFTRVDCILTEDGCTQLQTGGFTSLSDTQVISSLDTWGGKHIEKINIFVGNSIGNEVDVELVNIMIRCAV